MYLNFQEALKGGSKKDWKKWDGHLKLKATKEVWSHHLHAE